MPQAQIEPLSKASFKDTAHNLIVVGGTSTGKAYLASTIECCGHTCGEAHSFLQCSRSGALPIAEKFLNQEIILLGSIDARNQPKEKSLLDAD